MERKLMKEDEVVQKYGISLAKLRRYRLTGAGPAYVKMGHLVFYSERHIEAFIESCVVGGPLSWWERVRRFSVRLRRWCRENFLT